MSELDFFLTKEELVQLLTEALDNRFKIQVNRNLAAPAAEFCHSRGDLEAAVENGHYAFLLGRDDFTRYPTKLRRAERDGKEFWYPRAKEGGPVIEAYFFAPFQKAGSTYIPCSLLSAHTQIVGPHGRLEPAGPEVAKALKGLAAPLQAISQTVRSARKSALVTPGVQRALQLGAMLSEPFAPKDAARR